MLCYLRKIWTAHFYARPEAEKAAWAAEKTHQQATVACLAASKALAINLSQQEAADRKAWLNGDRDEHTIRFEAWRSPWENRLPERALPRSGHRFRLALKPVPVAFIKGRKVASLDELALQSYCTVSVNVVL